MYQANKLNKIKAVLAICFSILICSILRANEHEDTSVKVGVITSLTGPVSVIDTAVSNGINLAIADSPNMPRKIKFIFEDDGLNTQRMMSAYRKLVTIDGVQVLIVFGVVQIQILAPLIEQAKIPTINMSFVSDPLVGKKYIIRSLNNTDQYMQIISEHLKENNISQYQVVQTDSVFTNTMVSSLSKHDGKNLETRVFLPDDYDFRTTILKLKQLNTKHVGLFLFPQQIISFMEQARALRYQPSIFGTDLCESAVSQARDPSLLNGCTYPDNQADSDFALKYKKTFNNLSQLTFAANAYDMASMLIEFISQSAKFDSNDLLKRLRDVKNRKGVLGAYTYRNIKEHGSFYEYPIVKKIIRDE